MRQNPKKILIVEDDAATRRLLVALLAREYRLAEAATGEEALDKFSSFAPHLVALDIDMPGIDGFETCRQLRARPFGERVQVIMVSGRSSREEQAIAFQSGADDYVVKPFDANELRSRIHVHFRLAETMRAASLAQAEIDVRRSLIEQLEKERARQVLDLQDATILALTKVADFRDKETGQHLLRLRSYCQILAEHLGEEGPYADHIDEQFLENLYRSSPLHDIGKVGISDAILLKPGGLSPDEFEVMNQHTVIGANILEHAVVGPVGSFLSMAAVIARFHHERFDGTGYLGGLQGKEIPLAARIVALADVYDALTSARPYKSPIPPSKARKIIEDESGRHFDPAVVEAFQSCLDDFLRIQEQHADHEPVLLGAMSFFEHHNALAVC